MSYGYTNDINASTYLSIEKSKLLPNRNHLNESCLSSVFSLLNVSNSTAGHSNVTI